MFVGGRNLEDVWCVPEVRGPRQWVEYSNVGKLDVCYCMVESPVRKSIGLGKKEGHEFKTKQKTNRWRTC